MSQDGQPEPIPEISDAYMRKAMDVANMTNRLYHELENLIDVEEARGTSFLDDLIKIEAWCDKVASLQEKRLAYIKILEPDQGPPAS